MKQPNTILLLILILCLSLDVYSQYNYKLQFLNKPTNSFIEDVAVVRASIILGVSDKNGFCEFKHQDSVLNVNIVRVGYQDSVIIIRAAKVEIIDLKIISLSEVLVSSKKLNPYKSFKALILHNEELLDIKSDTFFYKFSSSSFFNGLKENVNGNFYLDYNGKKIDLVSNNYYIDYSYFCDTNLLIDSLIYKKFVFNGYISHLMYFNPLRSKAQLKKILRKYKSNIQYGNKSDSMYLSFSLIDKEGENIEREYVFIFNRNDSTINKVYYKYSWEKGSLERIYSYKFDSLHMEILSVYSKYIVNFKDGNYMTILKIDKTEKMSVKNAYNENIRNEKFINLNFK